MGKKSRLQKPTLAESKSVIGFAVVMLLAFLGMLYGVFHSRPEAPVQGASHQVPIYFRRIADAMPFPPTLDPSQFQISTIREAYSVAKEIPEVLAQQPCYCYCQRQGHRSLLDCFTSLHATSCDICINEARLAGQLSRQGKTAEEIRAAIIQKDSANLGSSR
jgi:uncharacterized protein with PCYCGC motif